MLDIRHYFLFFPYEEHPFSVIFPHENPQCLSMPTGPLVFRFSVEIAEKEALCSLHALALLLPQLDGVYDGGGQHVRSCFIWV